MKYTIELTNKQKAQMDCMIDIVHRYVGFNPKLEPIETTNVEDTTEYKMGYEVGFENGKKQAIEEIPELANKENEIYNDVYNKGYNKGLEDAWKFAKKIMLNESDGGYPGSVVHKIFGATCYDVLANNAIHEIKEKIEAYEEKKAEEETIKVGDVIYSEMTDSKAIIISFDAWNNWNCIDTCGTGFAIDESKKEFWKKIGHFDEVGQLLDKLNSSKEE